MYRISLGQEDLEHLMCGGTLQALTHADFGTDLQTAPIQISLKDIGHAAIQETAIEAAGSYDRIGQIKTVGEDYET